MRHLLYHIAVAPSKKFHSIRHRAAAHRCTVIATAICAERITTPRRGIPVVSLSEATQQARAGPKVC